MNSLLISPISQKDIPTPSLKPEKKQSADFSRIITDVMGGSTHQSNGGNNVKEKIFIGEITHDVSTVSELLSRHENLRDSTWNIIYSDQNKDRDYTKIKPGTAVYYSPENGALSWSAVDSPPLPNRLDNNSPLLRTTISGRQTFAQSGANVHKELISLGKINEENPTVSNLLSNHRDMKEQMWDILGSEINKDKAYHLVSAGTEIQLNSETMELVWDDTPITATARTISPAIVDPKNVTSTTTKQQKHSANNLSEAVQGFKGISYDKINCYELLVKGLDNLNISYSGKNGLYSKLTNMAAEKGLASNAYLNGEGIVKAAGSTILSKNYSKIVDWKGNAEKLIEEIEPLLGSGQILSFSTKNRGHTGVVGQKDSQWTYINSGRMDNSVDQQTISRGVGEEVLSKEICNWFRSAQRKGETLSVTLGQLDQGKIRTAFNMSDSFDGRI